MDKFEMLFALSNVKGIKYVIPLLTDTAPVLTHASILVIEASTHVPEVDQLVNVATILTVEEKEPPSPVTTKRFKNEDQSYPP